MLMIPGDCKIDSNPTLYSLYFGANLYVHSLHFVLESKNAIDKDQHMSFDSFIGDSALNSLENMIPPPQPSPSFESRTLTYSY